MHDVREKRAYKSELRQEGAERTRRSIISAAHHLFLTQGYAATTLKEVAAHADVALPTVYAAFRNKRNLLMAVFDAARLGVAAEDSQGEHERVREMLRNPTAQVVARQVRLTRDGGAPVAGIISKAAAADPQIAELWQQTQKARYINMRRVAFAMRKRGVLPESLPVSIATDALWALTSNEMYELLVLDRGWPPDRYERWLASAIESAVFSAL